MAEGLEQEIAVALLVARRAEAAVEFMRNALPALGEARDAANARWGSLATTGAGPMVALILAKRYEDLVAAFRDVQRARELVEQYAEALGS